MNVQNQSPQEATAISSKWMEAFHKADGFVFHKNCAKAKASLVKLLKSGTLNETLAKDLAFILATHHTEYEMKYMTDENEIEEALKLNKTYWDLYEFPFAWIR